jgi:hypothetical protein
MEMVRQMKMRLAVRVEGNFWNAYIAEMGTMNNSRLIGSLAMGIASDPTFKTRFMQLMQDGFAEAVKTLGGKIEGWNEPERAPEAERAGRA